MFNRQKKNTRLQNIQESWFSAGFLTQSALLANMQTLIGKHIIPNLKLKQEQPYVLDIGCGHQPYKPLIPVSCHWIGVNPDTDNASPTLVADGLLLPFHNQQFDFVLCTQVIEHVSDPLQLVQEISRCLKPGGLLLLSGPMYWPLHEEPHDYWRFTKYGLRQLLKRTGLEEVEMRNDGSAISLTLTSINHLFRGFYFAPLRLALNILGVILEKITPVPHSTPNLSLIAKKLP